MSNTRHLVLIHGWGLNSAVWQEFAATLEYGRPDLKITNLDLPGYGTRQNTRSSADLSELALDCLSRISEPAVLVGWSLGGMVALQAALLDKKSRVRGLQLINSTPRFTRAPDWPSGVDLTVFRKFTDNLSRDYQRTLTQFLLLQAGSGRDARQMARNAHAAVCRLPAPSKETLIDGIDCLANTDLRSEISDLSLPVQVLCGARDRVTHPQSSHRLAALLDAPLVELDCGHAPFLSHPEETQATLLSFLDSINRRQACL